MPLLLNPKPPLPASTSNRLTYPSHYYIHPIPIISAARTNPDFPDYDRDYYDELKAQTADIPNVSVFSKHDYTIDPLDVPWLYDHRGRDIKSIRKNLPNIPLEEGELTGLPTRPMRLSDMHTNEEIEKFEERARECDPPSGRVWHDPMPPSDFQRDPDWIHLRKIDDKQLSHVRQQPVIPTHDQRPALKRTLYNSETDEMAALFESFHSLQEEHLDEQVEPVMYGHSQPIPTKQQFDKWHREAEKRGGNSTRYESYYLPPFRDNLSHKFPSFSDTLFPTQHDSLVDAHLGEWTGYVSLFSVLSGKKFVPSLTCVLPCHSDISLNHHAALEWNTVVVHHEAEILSSQIFSHPKAENALIPGRGVSAEGSFVCNHKKHGLEHLGITGNGLSLQRNLLSKTVTDREIIGRLEICMITTAPYGIMRHRVVLCTNAKEEDQERQKANLVQFSHILVFTERRKSDSFQLTPQKLSLPTTTLQQLLGEWAGTGVLLQPEYPPMSVAEIETTHTGNRLATITEEHVSWVENQQPDKPDQMVGTSRSRQRTLKKKKVSKRVSDARAYDRKRLIPCTLLITDKIGTFASEDMQAWQALPSEELLSHMYSPRIGKFCDDYCGIVVSESLLLTFPFGKAYPAMWNTISLQQITKPNRQRIVAGRNEVGDLVGVLFASEQVEDDDAWDDVASYV